MRLTQLADVGDGVWRNRSLRFLTPGKARELRCTILEKDDVLVARMPDPSGRSCLFPGDSQDCVTVVDVCIVRPCHDGISVRWLSHFINAPQFRLAIYGLQSGSTRKRISRKNLGTLELHLPPTNEQHRIAEAIESYFTRLDDAVATLERVQRNLKRYRASVLKAAVEGRLVPTEAELARAEGRDYEPASVLLERILTERRRRWEESELAKMNAKGKPPKNDKWKAKYKEPAEPDAAEFAVLTSGWCWASIDQLADDQQSNALTDGPFGSHLKSAHYEPLGPRVIRLQNIGDGVFVDAHAHISQEHYKRLIKHAALPDDVVIASLGQELPRACLVPEWLGEAVVKADCLRFAVKRGLMLPHFAMHALNSPGARKHAEDLIHGVGRPRIGLTLLRSFPVPLPPLSEQARIVAEVERLQSVGDALLVANRGEESRLRRLRQAILKWAFEGKLVDQDPADEQATNILERITHEREVASSSTKTKKRARKKTRSTKA
ncbi:MAG: restriction endonuclease subunit S [Planctomycetota bacterium]